MTARSRILSGSLPSNTTTNSTNTNTTTTTPQMESLDSDFIVILAALLCALICVIGLAAVSRCSWIRDLSSSNYMKNANKGLKKKALKALPKTTYDCEKDEKFTECAICLTDFSDGEEIRVLPQCGHGFHVVCIDKWLCSHSSCPSCRKILVVQTRCKECNNAIQPEPRENHVNTFLP